MKILSLVAFALMLGVAGGAVADPAGPAVGGQALGAGACPPIAVAAGRRLRGVPAGRAGAQVVLGQRREVEQRNIRGVAVGLQRVAVLAPVVAAQEAL